MCTFYLCEVVDDVYYQWLIGNNLYIITNDFIRFNESYNGSYQKRYLFILKSIKKKPVWFNICCNTKDCESCKLSEHYSIYHAVKYLNLATDLKRKSADCK